MKSEHSEYQQLNFAPLSTLSSLGVGDPVGLC
jgi:hypothetical protein